MNGAYKKNKILYEVVDCYIDDNQEQKVLYKEKDKDSFFIKKAKDFFKKFKKVYL